MTKFILALFLFISTILPGYESVAAQTSSALRVNVQIVTDEADAVLQILAKKGRGQEITEADWQKVFTSEGYIRLKNRELSLQRSFEDADFKTFVLSEKLAQNRQALAETLAKWKETNINEVAERPLTYLPKDARIRAKVYPVIKPRENSFVFDIPDDPAIFLYLDPTVSKEKFENTLAHELHHIGYGSSCPAEKTKTETEKLSPNEKTILKWLGAFGEGFAMLAAAGGVDVHPHAVSLPQERERWDKDVANFNDDLKKVERFFLDALENRSTEDDTEKTARSFYGVQGPWYTRRLPFLIFFNLLARRIGFGDSLEQFDLLLFTLADRFAVNANNIPVFGGNIIRSRRLINDHIRFDDAAFFQSAVFIINLKSLDFDRHQIFECLAINFCLRLSAFENRW